MEGDREQERKVEEAAVPVGAIKSPSGQPDWKGLLKWSLANSDSTGQPPRRISEGDRKWFMDAMQANTIDVVKRMKEITSVIKTPRKTLEEQGVSAEDIEGVLEELQEHVESIDMANDLNTVGGLDPLIELLKDDYAPIRARAAEVISTMVQNNPKSQKEFMEHKGLESLLNNFTSDPDVTVRTKALGAISSLIRHNKPATAAFRLANGFSSLKGALLSDDSKLQRKALQVMQYLLQENPKDNVVAAEFGFPRLLTNLASTSNADVREGALKALLEVTRNDEAASMAWGTGNVELKPFLESRIDNLQQLNPEELSPLKDERQLLDSLWNACFGQPSALREKGLLILPGEDELPPDVLGKMFEPPLRSSSTRSEVDESNKKKEAPPLLLSL